MKKGYIITGCGTDVGKTVVSAILTKALDALYWKPVQCGSLDCTDDKVVQMLSGKETLSSSYLFKTPASPHIAAEKENEVIDEKKLQLPKTSQTLIVEGAGGVLVPLRNDLLFADLFAQWKLPIVFVSRHYLGSINHTLLSLEAIERRGLQINVLVFNGPSQKQVERVIMQRCKARHILHLFPETLDAQMVEKYAALWAKELL